MSRQTPFSAVIAGLTPFLVSRQVVTGSGRVGIGPAGDEPGFQLSQRADYIEVEVGLETTLKRDTKNGVSPAITAENGVCLDIR
ncbi:proteasome accessory factor PafA2 family protein [Mycobacterium kyorinense]|uniref:proteasome accessory factor PafA2 family protein n=1 Tax=Mycobacterium kyorinense TaxID=487514 RepID=UPI0026AB5476